MASLIKQVLREYGPLSIYQILEILDCLNLYGALSGPNSLRSDVTSVMHQLFSRDKVITYEPKSGRWSLCILDSQIKTHLRIPDFSQIETQKIQFKEIGTGDEYVYALYLPYMRFTAAVNDWKLFPIKIGRTKNLFDRIAALSFTGPGMLVPGVVLRTSNSVEDEQRIHQALRRSRSNIELGSRREWFSSNLLIIHNLLKDIARGRSI